MARAVERGAGVVEVDAFERGGEAVRVALAPDLAVADDVEPRLLLRADRDQGRVVLRLVAGTAAGCARARARARAAESARRASRGRSASRAAGSCRRWWWGRAWLGSPLVCDESRRVRRRGRRAGSRGAASSSRAAFGDDAALLEHIGAVRDAPAPSRRSARPAARRCPAALMRRIASNMSCTIGGARPSDGSSSSSRRGRAISARPIATICCWPPDSSPAGLRELGSRSAGNRARARVERLRRARAFAAGR